MPLGIKRHFVIKGLNDFFFNRINMTPVQEMVFTLFSEETIGIAKKQLKSRIEITHIEKFDMPFRLLRVDDKTVNLEILVNRMFGPARRTEIGMVRDQASYFKPIGVYNIESGFFSDKVSITIIYEFEKHFSSLAGNQITKINHQVKKLTLEENIVIAAFSMDAFGEAKEMIDKNLVINGLSMEIVMAFGGYPQIFLDDKYNIEGPIAAYFVEGPSSLNPIVNYKKTFDELDSKKLLSAYKWA